MKHVIRDVLRKLRRKTSLNSPSQSAFNAQKKLLSSIESPIIFDVGANIGQTTKIYRTIFPAAKIFAFEPYNESFEQLKLKYDEEENTQVFRLALGSTSGHQTFHVNPSSPTNSLLATDGHGPKVWGEGLLETVDTVQVDVVRLDDFLRNIDVDRIDLMKLDVQGAEHLVLEGAIDALRENRISVIFTEIITMPTYVGQISFHEMLRKFDDHNFDLYNIYNLSTVDGRLRQVDAIFVNRLSSMALSGSGA